MVGRLLLVGALALSACGDDDDDDIAAPDAAASDALAGPSDARPRFDAGPDHDAAPGVDGASVDAGGTDGGPALADLEATGITRGVSYYKVQYCNAGTIGGEGTFRVRITNVTSSETFETPPAFPIPGPGACTETGGITCGLIGDPDCSLRGEVFGFVDSSNAVVEADEANNQIVVGF
jgi:hypothetical protein